MSDIQFAQVLEQALQLTPDEQARLVDELRNSSRQLEESSAVREASTASEVEAWDEAELAELLTHDPLPPAEVIALGLLGTWADMGITDGAEWVNEQKRKRQERLKW